MKAKIIYILIGAGALSFSGCDKNFLDQDPPLNLTENQIYTNSSRLEGVVVGMYRALHSQYILGGKTLPEIDNIGDDFINVSGNGYELQQTYEMTVGISVMDNYDTWGYFYQAINQANTVIENLSTYKDNIDASKYNQYMAEAKFCRAISYYYLHQFWTMPYAAGSSIGGGPEAKSVVLRLKAEKDTEGNDKARSTSKEVLDQILSDTEDLSNLPEGDQTETTIARASKAAAHMLRMRVYMVEENWDNAIKEGEAVSGYSLTPSVATALTAPYTSKENIFSIAFASTNLPDGQYACPYFYLGGRSCVLDKASGIVSIKGYGEAKDARIINFTNLNAGGRCLTKYPTADFSDWLPVFRYAETLLNLAECYANKGDDEKARTLLLQVRRRSLAAADDPLKVEGMTGTALKTAIYNEKRLELLGEGVRGFDLRRRVEDIVKQPGTVYEIVTKPSSGTSAYIWDIPQTERSNNNLIE